MRRRIRPPFDLRRLVPGVNDALKREAIHRTPPHSGASAAIPSGASTTAIDLSSHAGRWVTIKSDVAAHVRFGEAGVGAATAGDWPLSADVDLEVRVPEDGALSFARVLDAGVAGGRIFYGRTSEPA